MARAELGPAGAVKSTVNIKQAAGWTGLAACLVLFPWLVMGPYGDLFLNLERRFWVYAFLMIVGAGLVKLVRAEVSWPAALVSSAVLLGFVYKVATFIPEVSTYPLSLAWSEASRYYYASLFLSKEVYGVAAPLSVLHPTRYLMQAAPFLVPGLPLWIHRFWQVLLWLGFSLAAGWIFARRLGVGGLWMRTILAFWTALFLFQGPVYYHLLVMFILVLWGFDRRQFRWSLAVVVLASAWGGISRVNWIPVPGLLAATLFLLEEPFPPAQAGSSIKRLWHYLWRPAAWVLAGALAGLATQQAYILWSGNPPEHFGSSFESALLWYRLKPSVTYPLGVLRGITLAGLPLALVAAAGWARSWKQVHPIRVLGLAAILGVFLVGGLVVSAKIGGGSNLHNLDAFLALLLVAGSALALGAYTREEPGLPSEQRALTLEKLGPIGGLAAALAAAAPVLFAVTTGGPLPARDFEAARAAVQQLRELIYSHQTEGEVLFISERHLLTFNEIEGVPLVPDYEKVFLMEMAMANNRPYLDAFENDLRNHRFSLIVSHPLHLQYQGSSHPFGEENDAWVERVSEPVLCYYQPYQNLPGVLVQVLVPQQDPGECAEE